MENPSVHTDGEGTEIRSAACRDTSMAKGERKLGWKNERGLCPLPRGRTGPVPLSFSQGLLGDADHFADHGAADASADFSRLFRAEMPVVVRIQRNADGAGDLVFYRIRTIGVHRESLFAHHLHFQPVEPFLRLGNHYSSASSSGHMVITPSYLSLRKPTLCEAAAAASFPARFHSEPLQDIA